MIPKTKFCIFCGREPVGKTKEHVLPRWLIAMTGKPNRVVSFGYHPSSGENLTFAWSSFTFPACKACNERYSAFESQAQQIIPKLVERTPVTGDEYLHLLDWLDKVRIGLWLGYRYLHNNPLGINPMFHIETRLAAKDRMLAIYTIKSTVDGLNAHGAETLAFQKQPSCFSLRVNNTYILNMSWDYMCSRRCGFPAPREAIIDLDNDGMLSCSDFQLGHRVVTPLLDRRIVKPSVQLYQPIMSTPKTVGDYPNDDWLKSRILEGSQAKGLLHRQWDDRVEVVDSPSTLIEYGEITGKDCMPMKDIIAQTYDLQSYAASIYRYSSMDDTKLQWIKKWDEVAEMQNSRMAEVLRKQ